MTGPGLVRRIPKAASASRGLVSTSATEATTRSISRLATAADPSHGHEHLGRLQADLGAPGSSPVLEGFKRARVRVLAQLALVAGHGPDLGVERVADVDPGVRDEGPRVGPLGAARSVEGVDGLDEALARPCG